MEIKAFVNNKKQIKLFEGFIVQPGFIFGFIDGTIPFVSNGTIFSEYVKIYFQTSDAWEAKKIPNTNPLYEIIIQTANKNKARGIEKSYTSKKQLSRQLEQAQIIYMRRQGYDTKLYSTNGSVHRHNKCSKRVTNSAIENKYLQTKDNCVKRSIV